MKRVQDAFENCSTVVAFDSYRIALVNELGSKISSFQKGNLKKKIFSLHPRKGGHFVVFENGSVGSLKNLLEDAEAEYPFGILSLNEKLLDVKIFDDDISSYVVFTVEKEGIWIEKKKKKKKEKKGENEKVDGKEDDLMEVDNDGEPGNLIIPQKPEETEAKKIKQRENSETEEGQKNIVLIKCRYT